MPSSVLLPVVALALVAAAPAIASVVLSFVLSALTQCGLLSNIRVDARTRISIRATSVLLACWRQVWQALRTGTWTALVMLHIPKLHVTVTILPGSTQSPSELKGDDKPAKQTLLSEVEVSELSLKDLRHPVWRQLGERIRVVRALCRVLSVLAVSVGSISVNVIGEADGVTHEIFRLEDGSLNARCSYKSSTGNLQVAINLFGDEPTALYLPETQTTVHLGPIHFKAAIPISRNASDHCAPVPSSCDVVCQSIRVGLQPRAIIRAAPNRQDCVSLRARDELAPANDSTSENLLAGLVECIPTVKLGLVRVDVEIEDPDIQEVAQLTLSNIEVQVCDSAIPATETEVDQRNMSAQTVASKKTASFSMGTSELQLQCVPDNFDESVSRTILKLSRVKVACYVTLQIYGDNNEEKQDDSCGPADMLSVYVTIGGECRGLAVALFNDICPWVHAIYSDLQAYSSLDGDSASRPRSLATRVAVEVETQFKFVQTEVSVVASTSTCDVLPRGVPSICLTVDEINLYGHPFASEEQMGVRSKADLQATRLKMFFLSNRGLTRTLFLSLDFTRVFIAPLSLGNLKPTPAQVELEAEWLELKWAPEVLHAIAGMLELFMELAGPLLLQKSKSTQKDDSWTGNGLTENTRLFVPAMRTMEQVMSDAGSGSDDSDGPEAMIAFRCTIKRVCATFVHQYDEQQVVECLTADTCRMSVEESTGRFRISVEQIKVFEVRVSERLASRGSGTAASLPFAGVFGSQSPRRRPSFAFMNNRATSADGHTSPRQRGSTSSGQQSAKSYDQYFFTARFALEETKVRGGQSGVVDMFADDVKLDWTMPAQLRVTELVREITFASWEMLYRVRAAYVLHCTPADSDFNRPFGLNPPLDDEEECSRWESRLREIISGSGSTLHRMHATNIHVNALLTKSLTVNAAIGFFGGDDLPDLWRFGDISLAANALEMLHADTVRVRHTVAKRTDYVFGEFEAMARLRMRMTGRFDDRSISCPDDGMLVECDGLQLQTTVDFPLRNHLDALQSYFSPYAVLLEDAMARHWRPQHDLFYRYFLRTPPSSDRAGVWLDLRNISFRCLGSDFEGWLEKIYPIWMQELEERELRAQVFQEHIAALQLTSPGLLTADEAARELAALLAEKNARSYVQKMKKQRAANASLHTSTSRSQVGLSSIYQTPLIDVAVSQVTGDMTIGEAKADVWRFIKQMDEAVDMIEQQFRSAGKDFTAFEPSHLLLVSASIDLEVVSVTVQMRRFLTPIFHCDSIAVRGKTALSAWSQGDARRSADFDFTGALRCFPDLQVLVKSPMIWFCPSYIHALQEFVNRSKTLIPLMILNVDKRFNTAPWDMLRRLLHGKVTTIIENASLRLLSSPSSFELSDYLAVSLQHMTVAYELSKVDVELEQAIVKIEPWSLANCVEISSAKVTCWLNWSCAGQSSMHHAYPIEFYQLGGSEADKFIFHPHPMCSSSSSNAPTLCASEPGVVIGNPSNPFESYEASNLSVFIQGSVGCTNSKDELFNDSTNTVKAKREVPALTAVVLYRKHVEWLLKFGRLYYDFIQQLGHRHVTRPVQPPHVLPSPESMPSSMFKVLSGVIVENLDIAGIDVAIYRSEKHPMGIRTFIGDRVSFSGAFLHQRHEFLTLNSSGDSHAKGVTTVRRLSLPGELSEWIVHGTYAVARDIQVRVCSAESGSRGESLLTVKEVTFRAGGGDDGLPSHDGKLLIRGRGGDSSRTNSSGGSLAASSTLQLKPGQLRREASKTILDHFEIAQHNPYHFRDSDAIAESDAAAASEATDRDGSASFEALRQMGFLLGLFSREARVLVTFASLEALVDIAENWFEFITAHCPELLMPKLIERTARDDHCSAGEEGSPKKATSLAEDPKFGKIFDAYVKSNDGRRGSRNAITSDSHSSLSLRQTPDTPAVDTPSLVDPFLVVQFVDFQISFHDHANKGSVLVALSRGTLKDSISADKANEDIALEVEGVQMFTAPLDIDVKSRTLWLKAFADGSYCPSSSGLFKRVIAPIPATLIVWIERVPNAASPSVPASMFSKVQLKISAIEVAVGIASKDILQNLGVGGMELVTAKLSAMKVLERSDTQPSAMRSVLIAATGSSNPSSQRPQLTIQQLELMRKQLRWKMALIEWQQVCRWNHIANDFMGTSLDTGSEAFSPQFRRRRVTAAASSAASPCASFSSLFTDLAADTHSDGSSNLFVALTKGSVLAPSSSDKSEQLADDLLRSQHQHRAVSEVLASMIKSERERCATQPNIEFEASLDRAELTLSGENADILNAAARTLQFSMTQYEDRSGAFTLTLRELTARNLTPGTAYPELLQPAHSRSWGSDNLFLRVDAELGKPVDCTTLVKHFEVNVHPIQVCITQDIILQLIAFFAPPTAATASDAREEDQRRRRVRSQFLQPNGAHGSANCGSPSERLMGGAASKLKRAVRVAGKAATYPKHLAARTGTSTASREREDSTGDDVVRNARAPSNALQTLQDDAVEWMSKVACNLESGALGEIGSNQDTLTPVCTIDQDAPSLLDATPPKDKATKLITFKRIRFGTLEVLVTYKHKKAAAGQQHPQSPTGAGHPTHVLEDMRGFELKLHPLVYCDKTCSATDLLLRIRRDIVLDVLSQVGRNFTNIGNFLRDQFDLSRWAPFDALAPLRSLTAVAPLQPPPTGASAASPSRRPSVEASAGQQDDDGAGDSSGSSKHADHRGFQLELPGNHPALRKKAAGGGGLLRPSELLARSPRAQAAEAEGSGSVGKSKKSLSSLFSKKRSTGGGGDQ